MLSPAIKSRLRKLPGFRIASFLRRLTRDTETRNAALMLLRPPAGLYQPWGATSDNRYPEAFLSVRALAGDAPTTRILSFGCSTGEEVFSLRKYFPQATLIGLDINPWNILLCRYRKWRKGDARMHFAVAGSTTTQPSASYDAVFAMAVFRHGELNITPPPPRCDHLIRFSSFEQSIADLARILKPGGLLAMQNSMFRFEDTATASQFEPALSIDCSGPVPLYDRDNMLVPSPARETVVFRKKV